MLYGWCGEDAARRTRRGVAEELATMAACARAGLGLGAACGHRAVRSCGGAVAGAHASGARHLC